MICYKGKTFCVSKDCACGSKLTKEVIMSARRWRGNPDAPIAMAELCGKSDDLVARAKEAFREINKEG